MVLSQVMIVKLDQRLDRFLHRAQLDESHFTVFPERINNILRLPGNIVTIYKNQNCKKSYWKNLKALTTAPELRNKPLRSSSMTEGLRREEIDIE